MSELEPGDRLWPYPTHHANEDVAGGVPAPDRSRAIGITADEIVGGHCVLISRPDDLADPCEAYLDEL